MIVPVITGYRALGSNMCCSCTLAAIIAGRIMRDPMRASLAHFRDHRGFWMDYVESLSGQPLCAIFNLDRTVCDVCRKPLVEALYVKTPVFDTPATNQVKPPKNPKVRRK